MAKEKKLTPAQKYNQLKRQTESAGMKVKGSRWQDCSY
jgi:hypothetical protein